MIQNYIQFYTIHIQLFTIMQNNTNNLNNLLSYNNYLSVQANF